MDEQVVSTPPNTIHPYHHAKSFITFLLLIVFAALFTLIGVILGLWISNNRIPVTSTIVPTTAIQPTVRSTPTPTTEDIAYWKSARSDQFKFSLQYPPEYDQVTGGVDDGFVARTFNDGLHGAGGIQVVVEPENGTNCRDGLCETPAKRQLRVNGITWDVLGSTGYCDAGGCTKSNEVYRTVKDGNRFYIFFYNDTRSVELLRTFLFDN